MNYKRPGDGVLPQPRSAPVPGAAWSKGVDWPCFLQLPKANYGVRRQSAAATALSCAADGPHPKRCRAPLATALHVTGRDRPAQAGKREASWSAVVLHRFGRPPSGHWNNRMPTLFQPLPRPICIHLRLRSLFPLSRISYISWLNSRSCWFPLSRFPAFRFYFLSPDFAKP